MCITISYLARFDVNLHFRTDVYNYSEPHLHRHFPFYNVDAWEVNNSAFYNSGRFDLNVRNRDCLADRTVLNFLHGCCPILGPCTMYIVQIKSSRGDLAMF